MLHVCKISFLTWKPQIYNRVVLVRVNESGKIANVSRLKPASIDFGVNF